MSKDDYNGSEIALIGMAGRFPGASSPEELWLNVRNKVESIRRFSSPELLAAGVDPELVRHPRYVPAGTVVEEADRFDAGFFGYTPREAEVMDPQHRLFLQCAWEALEDAACRPETCGGLIGVFAGSGYQSYLQHNLASNPELMELVGQLQMSVGNERDSLASKVSYKLDLSGPSLAVQTFCSTSLVAVHLACQSLNTGECDVALAGGVAITFPQRQGYLFQEGGILSPDGRCRPFDAASAGSVMGNGLGIVALKRLDEAIADGDRIYSVIRGSAVNNDGIERVGYTAPGLRGQSAVIAEALAVAGVDPGTIDYVETHGTGTALGDSIEIAALKKAFAGVGDEHRCALASLKPNIGHLDRASGVTGLIRASLALHVGEMPPNLHFDRPNPALELEDGPFFVNTELRPWPVAGRPRRAGVNSFGLGGTNAHVVLEEPPTRKASDPGLPWQVLPLSAKTEEGLERMTERLRDHLERRPELSLANVAYTLGIGRASFNHRRIALCADVEDAVATLDGENPRRLLECHQQSRDREAAFLFPGVGEQWPGMVSGLYRHEPRFRRRLDALLEPLTEELDDDPREVLVAEPEGGEDDGGTFKAFVRGSGETQDGPLARAALAHPLVVAVELALVGLFDDWGIRPSSLLGYSLGEYTAACVAGVLSEEDVLRLVSRRAALLEEAAPGAMTAVQLPSEQVEALLTPELDLAVVNAPGACVVAGPRDAMAGFEEELAAREAAFRRLPTNRAVHSSLVEPIAERFGELIAGFSLQPPTISWVSNVTGTWIESSEATDPRYWVSHLRSTVRFSDALATLLGSGDPVLLEVGPGQSLGAFVQQLAAAGEAPPDERTTITTLGHPLLGGGDDLCNLIGALGRLWLEGVEVDWSRLCAEERRVRVALPTYPFAKDRYWVEPGSGLGTQSASGKNPNVEDWFYQAQWQELEGLPEPEIEGERWLLLLDERGVGDALAEELEELGVEALRAESGSKFGAAGPGAWTLDFRSGDDFRRLAAQLSEDGELPQRIVHLGSVDGGPETPPGELLDRGYYSLVRLVQALSPHYVSAELEIAVVAEGLHAVQDDDVPVAAKAAVLGPARIVPQEYPTLRCRTVDLRASEMTGPETPKAHRRALVALIAGAAPTAGGATALRAGRCWAEAHRPVKLPAPGPEAVRLRRNGVYLITGGFGGVGSILAEHLASRWEARLVLVGRSPVPPREEWDAWLEEHGEEDATSARLLAVRRLEELGAEVLACSADVADEAAMAEVVAEARDRFGSLHGVIHAAGVSDPSAFGVVQTITEEQSERHFQSKLYALPVLDRVLEGAQAEGDELDFCLLMSSLAAVLGGLWLVAYAAANACSDAYAVARSRRRNGSRWLAVDWDTWKLREIQHGGLGRTIAQFEMVPEEGVAAFERVVTEEAGSQVIHSTGDLDARKEIWLRGVADSGAAARSGTSGASRRRPGKAVAAGEVEQTILAVWRRNLGISEIGPDDSYFDLGGTSLTAIQVIADLQAELGVQLSPIFLFEAPTTAELARRLRAEMGLEEATQRPAPEPATFTTPSLQGDIAVVGLACRLPGAADHDDLWRMLKDGVETISFFSEDELEEAGLEPAEYRRSDYVPARGILDGIDLFDAGFFGISHREATYMDPQHRLFLECAWEALENAGYDPRRYPGRIGVFGGSNISTYLLRLLQDPEYMRWGESLEAAIANDRDSLATRVSYKLDLRGPSFTVQTFCSTSAVAVHLAARSLLSGDSEMAMAGGVSLFIPQKNGYRHDGEGGVTSPDGHTRAFDARAGGTVFSEGAGLVVLKRLENALADGDTIRAVIKGSSINNDGAMKIGYAAPSVDAQAEAIRRALAEAEIPPETIQLVETHGTATEIGDPIEVAALTRAFREGTDEVAFCALGSVKTNIGHVDRAAGVTSLIKTILALNNRTIPPVLHFERPNPRLDLERSPFYVNTDAQPWEPRGETPRRAGVNCLGVGGTNVHLVVEEAPAVPIEPSRPWQVLTLSARSPEALDQMAKNLARHLEEHPEQDLGDVAYTLQLGRRVFDHRRTAVCRSSEEAVRVLRGEVDGRISTHSGGGSGRRVSFLFPGFGDHYPEMAAGLYRQETSFRSVVDECCEAAMPEIGVDLREVLFPNSDREDEQDDGGSLPLDLRSMMRGRSGEHRDGWLESIPSAHVAIFVIEYALARLLTSWGLRPEALLGYSLGEYTAACLAGVLPPEEMLCLIARRARLMEELPEHGMLAVPLAADELAPLLGRELSVTVVIGPELQVVSGPAEALDELEASLEEREVVCRRLTADYAVHSPMASPVAGQLRDLVASFDLSAPRIPYLSNVTGTWVTAEQATDPEHWVRHLCQQVRFGEGLGELLAGETILLEVGPGQSLTSFAKQHRECAPERGMEAFPTLRSSFNRQQDRPFLLGTVGRLWLLGADVDWAALHAAGRRRVPLPTYPFERERYWLDPKIRVQSGPSRAERYLNEMEKEPLDDWFWVPSWRRVQAEGAASRDLVVDERCEAADELLEGHDAVSESIVVAREDEDEGSVIAYFVPREIPRPAREPERVETWPNGLRVAYQSKTESAHFYQDIFEKEIYLRHGIELPDEACVFDVGANIGSFSLFVAHACRDPQIYAFEPAPPLFACLRWTCAANGVPARLFNLGIAERSGLAPFTFYPQSSGMSSFHADKDEEKEILRLMMERERSSVEGVEELLGFADDLLEERFRSETFECRLRPLSDVIDECGVEWIDLLKIDVQKAEMEVLEGLRDEHWPLVRQIAVEVHDLDGRLARIQELLSERGYRVAVEQDELLTGSVLYNLFAIREDGGSPPAEVRTRQSSRFYRATARVDAGELEDRLRAELDGQLAKESRPEAVVALRRLPRDASGAVDLAALPAPSGRPVSDGRPWWVLADDLGLAEATAERLRAAGEEVVVIGRGDRFARREDGGYTVNPRRRADYSRLVAELQVPRGVLHAWSVAERPVEEGALTSLDRRLDDGFYSVLYLAQALGEKSGDEPVDLVVLADRQHRVTEDDTVDPVQATLVGACKVLPQEIERLSCRAVDVAWKPDRLDAVGELLAQEAALRPCGEQVLAVRDGALLRRTYARRPIPEPDGDCPRLRRGGVYLLTGGLGGIALATAEHLFRTVEARLALVGRSPLPPREDWRKSVASADADEGLRRKLQGILALEDAGAEVEVLTADVSDPQSIGAAVATGVARFGRIDGVFHAAAVPPQGLALFKDRRSAATIMAPKVAGTLALERALAEAGQELDFLFLFSSTSGITGGGPGQLDYAAANSFLEAYAATPSRHGHVVAASWGEWQWDNWAAGLEGFQEEAQEFFRESRRKFGISFAEGMRAIERLLAGNERQVAVSPLDFYALLRGSEDFSVAHIFEVAEQGRTEANLHARPVLGVEFTAASSEVERSIAQVWQRVLKLESVGIDDNFFDLGGTSLIGMQLVNEIKRDLDVDLAPVAIYEAPTVRALARSLEPERDEEGESEGVAELRRRREAVREKGDRAVAIIGLAGRFPGAAGVREFWQNLAEGIESVTFLTDEELLAAGVSPEELADGSYVKAAGVVESIEDFDAQLFGLSPSEATVLDPQHRLFLECCWEALDHSGYNSQDYEGLIGVFGGANTSTYLLNNILHSSQIEDDPAVVLQAGISNTNDSLATRVSYRLDLKGPSVTVQTFCSTSAVATHMACRSLIDGECDVALGGGVRIAVPHRVGYRHQVGSIDSADGHTRTFDARASGALNSNGATVVVLKRLADALADNDTIYAVIKGSAVNNDGSTKVGYTAPSVDGQVEAIRGALAAADVPVDTIDYVEAHGTATEIGDPIEVTALTKAYRRETEDRQFCGIGSLKANVGHMDRASGGAALIKMACAFHHGFLPKLLHFEEPNPKIDFESSPFFVQAEERQWTRNGRPRRAAINALGLGGTNVHFILEEAPERPPSDPSRAPQLLVLSAKTRPALEQATDDLARALEEQPDLPLADVAFTLQVGRRRLDYRRMLVAESAADAREALETRNSGRLLTRRAQQSGRKPTFMFPGLGDHYRDMAAGLYAEETAFRASFDECSELLRPYLQTDLHSLIFSGDPAEAPGDADGRQGAGGVDLRAMIGRNGGDRSSSFLGTIHAQPAVFAVEYALAQQWLAWGVRPESMIGYSVGEYVAACLSGVMDLEDALCLVALRARMIEDLEPGGLLAVPLGEEECREILGDADLWVASVNGPGLCVVGGREEDLDRLAADLAERDLESQRIAARHAFHTPMMDPIAGELEDLAETMALRSPRVPFLSNVSGTWITADEATDPAYWARHLCRTIRFADGLAVLAENPDRIYLEVGPGQSLSTIVRQNAMGEAGPSAVASLRPQFVRRSDSAYLREALGRLWMAGADVSLESLHGDEVRHRIPLPTYPFDRKRYWIEPATNGHPRRPKQGKRPDVADWFYLPSFRPALPPAPVEGVADGGTEWMVLSSGSALEERLVSALRDQGCRVVVARPGSAFGRESNDRFVVDPVSSEDYEAVFQELDGVPAGVVHAGLLAPAPQAEVPGAGFARVQEMGFYSLLALARALSRLDSTKRLSLFALTSGVLSVTEQEPLEPEKATALAVTRVLPQEYLNVGCRDFDVVPPEPGSETEARLVEHLVAELLSPGEDLTVAYRGARRFVQTWEPVRLEPAKRPVLRRQGTYLLVGGFGGVGLTLARRLAADWHARLVLVGRTALPPRDEWEEWLEANAADDPVSLRIASVLDLEELGAEVLAVRADIADEAEMAQSVSAARERFGSLHGVVHLAGTLDDASFQSVTQIGPKECEWHFGPKVHGVYALDRVLRDEDLDFCLLASSLSSVLGGLGLVGYAAANMFMDAFVQRLHRAPRSSWLTVNWDSWQLDPHQHDTVGRTLAAYEMLLDEGWDAFLRLVGQAGRVPRVVQSTGDLEARFDQWVRLEGVQSEPTDAPAERHARPDLATPFVAAETEVEKTIVGIWESLLQIEGVGTRDDFFELGGHSLLGTRLFTRLRETLGVELPLRSIFELPTVHQIAELVETLRWRGRAEEAASEAAGPGFVEGEL